MDTRLENLIELYDENCKRLHNVSLGNLGKGAKSDYPSRIRRLYSFVGNKMLFWIDKKKIDEASDQIKLLNTPSAKSLSSAFTHFYNYVAGLTDGEKRVENTVKSIVLAQIIANSALFVNKKTVEDVIMGVKGSNNNKGKGNIFASWDHCQSRRKHSKETLGATYNDPEFGEIVLDSNNKANYMFKRAIAEMLKEQGIKEPSFKHYTVCHIWDNCAHDNKFYTSVVNMVLVPHALRSLTDFDEYVKDVLRYRSYELYGELCQTRRLKFPVETNTIKKPAGYDKIKWA